MTARIEWRTRGKGKDTLIYVSEFGEDANTAVKSWEATPDVLSDFLNDMSSIDTGFIELETNVEDRNPEEWGDLVMTRARDGGDVLSINPELYWDAVYYWFRAHGRDPHPWSRK